MFIAIPGEVTKGRERMKKGWTDFFNHFPDYRNIFLRTESRGNLVIMIGYSECSYEALHGPAIWTAIIEEEKVAEWRVYEDTKQNRQQLDIE